MALNLSGRNTGSPSEVGSDMILATETRDIISCNAQAHGPFSLLLGETILAHLT